MLKLKQKITIPTELTFRVHGLGYGNTSPCKCSEFNINLRNNLHKPACPLSKT